MRQIVGNGKVYFDPPYSDPLWNIRMKNLPDLPDLIPIVRLILHDTAVNERLV